MRKFLIVTIPITALACFILIMLSAGILKKSLVNGSSVPESIKLIVSDVEAEDWSSANENTENLLNVWGEVVKRIQFSSERDEINSFDTSLARIRGAIAAQDKTSSLIELNEAYEHWDGVGR